MSSYVPSSIQAQRSAGGQAGTAGKRSQPQAQVQPQFTQNAGLCHTMAMDHFTRKLINGALDANPLILVTWLQRNEIWLSNYLMQFYSCQLPFPVNSRHSYGTAAGMTTNSRNFAQYMGSGAVLTAGASTAATDAIARVSGVNTAPSNTVADPVVIEDNEEIEPSDSPRTSSSHSTAWPTEEDQAVQYPAPQEVYDKERDLGMMTGSGNRWTVWEQDLAIFIMFEIMKDPKTPHTEVRFLMISERLNDWYGIDRSEKSVKNMWNRIGRVRSKFDERKNKKAPLATSRQGKQARMENEAKKSNNKRKASAAAPAAPPTKMSKTTLSIDPALAAGNITRSPMRKPVFKSAEFAKALSQQDSRIPPYYRDASTKFNVNKLPPGALCASNSDMPDNIISSNSNPKTQTEKIGALVSDSGSATDTVKVNSNSSGSGNSTIVNETEPIISSNVSATEVEKASDDTASATCTNPPNGDLADEEVPMDPEFLNISGNAFDELFNNGGDDWWDNSANWTE